MSQVPDYRALMLAQQAVMAKQQIMAQYQNVPIADLNRRHAILAGKLALRYLYAGVPSFAPLKTQDELDLEEAMAELDAEFPGVRY